MQRVSSTTIAADLLQGADEIAEFLFGDREQRRRVYNHVERGQLPVFRLGNQVCARRSAILIWIAAQEAGCANSGREAA
jgi:hypothetical protein